jgi:hypothetical protein
MVSKLVEVAALLLNVLKISVGRKPPESCICYPGTGPDNLNLIKHKASQTRTIHITETCSLSRGTLNAKVMTKSVIHQQFGS